MSAIFTEAEFAALARRHLPASQGPISDSALDGCVLFGAGVLSRQIMAHAARRGLRPAWIVDNDPAARGKLLGGVEIRGADSLAHAGDRLVVIASSFLAPMAGACESAGVGRWAWFTDLADIFGGIEVRLADLSCLESPDVQRLAGLLDAESRQVLRNALAFRATGERQDLPEAKPDQYFAPDIVPPAMLGHFVDCGAYVGDTLEDWARRVDRAEASYVGFEPDPDNFLQLRETCRRIEKDTGLECLARPEAVGSSVGTIGMAQGCSGTVLGPGHADGPTARVVRLDDALVGRKASLLKMDLEGFEPLALEGARTLIRERLPALAIAIYHRPDHLWRIPLWIHDLGLGYRLRLRHHSPSFAETVCYAIPEGK